MKKKNLVLLVLLLETVFLLNSCVSVNESLIIAPDPDNPFQGTWIATMSPNYMHVINGMNGEWYVSVYGWKKQAIYTIEKKDDGYMTSNNWRISVTKSSNGDILTVENMTYERYVKK